MKKIGLLALFFILVFALTANSQPIRPGMSTDESGYSNVNVVDASSGTQTNEIVVEGGTAEDAASTQKPIHIGGIAESTVPTEVSDGDAIGAWLDTFGRLILAGYNNATQSLNVTLLNAPPVDDACTHLLDVTVNADGESFDATMFIGEAKLITVYVWNDETASADDSEVNVTIELSPDGTALMTAQTGMINSEDQAAAAAGDWTFDTDEERYFWFPQPITAQYLKATVTCDADCDGSDYHAFDLWVCTSE